MRIRQEAFSEELRRYWFAGIQRIYAKGILIEEQQTYNYIQSRHIDFTN